MITNTDVGKTVIVSAPNGARYHGKLRAITIGTWAVVKIAEIDIGYGWEAVNELKVFLAEWCTVEEAQQ